MGKIYENATGVIVYAGPDEAEPMETEAGIALSNLLGEHYNETFEMMLSTILYQMLYARRRAFQSEASLQVSLFVTRLQKAMYRKAGDGCCKLCTDLGPREFGLSRNFFSAKSFTSSEGATCSPGILLRLYLSWII